MGISLYGAPRDVTGGRAVGSLWLNWEDERQAAKPYLPEFAAREARLQGRSILELRQVVAGKGMTQRIMRPRHEAFVLIMPPPLVTPQSESGEPPWFVIAPPKIGALNRSCSY